MYPGQVLASLLSPDACTQAWFLFDWATWNPHLEGHGQLKRSNGNAWMARVRKEEQNWREKTTLII